MKYEVHFGGEVEHGQKHFQKHFCATYFNSD